MMNSSNKSGTSKLFFEVDIGKLFFDTVIIVELLYYLETDVNFTSQFHFHSEHSTSATKGRENKCRK